MKVLCVVVFMFITPIATLANFVVINNADSGAGSLRQAILDANAQGGGTITFSNMTGTIALGSTLPVLVTNTMILGPGPNQLAVVAATAPVLTNAPGSTAYIRGLTFTGSNGIVRNAGALTLNDCIVANGYTTFADGVGIFSSGALVLRNCTVSGNLSSGAQHGAGIYNSGRMSMSSCVVTNNRGPFAQGGGIYNSGYVSMDDCIVTKNHPIQADGAGIYNAGAMDLRNCLIISNSVAFASGCGVYNSGTLTLNTCTVAGNFYAPDGSGGGIYNSRGTVLLVECSITNNTAIHGGGVWNSGWLELFSSTISGNRATYSGGPTPGGGIYNDTPGTAILENTTVSGNTSLDLGAGIMNFGALLTVNCTIVSNLVFTADAPVHAGGGVWNSGTANSKNTIFAGNSAPQGPDFYGKLTSQGYNLIQNPSGVTNVGIATGNLLGVDPLLGSLQDNGGPTRTHALLCGSPAIDAATADGAPSTDQRGVPRPQGLDFDIGSFELQNTVPTFTAAIIQSRTNFLIRTCVPRGATYTLQASTNLRQWFSITNFNPSSNGVWVYTDPGLKINPLRFYRLLSPAP